jgi:pyruvate dehydrogenase E1 component
MPPRENVPDSDPLETAEWLASAEAVKRHFGTQRVEFLLEQLREWCYRSGARFPFSANTPYINTIPVAEQPPFPGDREIERRIKNYARWNAMAMVIRANRAADGIGGHLSTYASATTLFEIGFNHFFHAKPDRSAGDQVYFQGLTRSPSMLAPISKAASTKRTWSIPPRIGQRWRAGVIPHPWLMSDFW